MQVRVEVLTCGTVAFQFEACLEGVLELRGDGRKGAVFQVTVCAGGGDVVEDADKRVDDLILPAVLWPGMASLERRT